MNNLCNRPPYQKGTPRKPRGKRTIAPHLADLLFQAIQRGTPKKYEKWLRSQPSAIDGQIDYDPDTGLSYCDPCHYRTAANSGTGVKPDYCAIPMTHKQHLLQHATSHYDLRPPSWWEKETRYYLLKWINEAPMR